MTKEKLVSTTCPSCNAEYQVPETILGKKVNCKKCGASFEVAGRKEDKERGGEHQFIVDLALKYKNICE